MFPWNKKFRSKRHREKIRRRFLFLGTVVFFSCLVFFGLLVYLSRLSHFQISEINVEGNIVTQESDVKNLVFEDLSHFYLGLFPYSNSLIAPHEKIEKSLLETFPRLYDVEILYNTTKVLDVHLEERKPVALWCGVLTPEKECSFVDQEGVPYAEAPDFSGDVFTRIHTDLEDISSESLAKVLVMSDFLNKYSADISYFYLATPLEGYFVLLSFLEGGTLETRILVSLEDDPGRITKNLQTFFEVEEGVGIKKPQFINYEYIDARFGEQVYYNERVFTSSTSL